MVNLSGEPNGIAVFAGEPNQAAEMSQYNLPKSCRETKFLKGATKFAEIEKIIKDIPVLYEVAMVQPRLKKSGLPEKLAEILSASDEHLIKA